MSLAPGSRLGPYEVIGPLGKGGMGEVYRARDTKLDRQVALKILPDLLAAEADRLVRFEREAKTLASLNHPNIAAIFGIEESAGLRAIVMELVEGDDLSVHIARGPMPLEDALAIAKQIAEALDAAHEAGIVHRDLKPANVMLRPDGTVKVLDFGLAKALAPDGASGAMDPSTSPTLTARATQMGMIIGTAAYMAPEQAKGKAVDRRADIWAFGVVLYEMLTGRRAFQGDDITDVLASVLKEKPPLDALPADTPPSIRRLLRRCLERDRAKRLGSIHVAKLEIEDAGADHDALPGSTQGHAPPARSIALPIVAAVVVTALAVGAAVWQWMQPPPAEPQRFSITPAPDAPIHVETNHPDLAILPDGKGFVYLSQVGVEYQFVVRRFDQFSGTLLSSAKLGMNARGLFVSPDGQWLGFQSGPPSGVEARLWKVPIGGGAPVPLCDLTGNLRGAHWAAGDRIVFGVAGASAGVYSISASGGTPEVLTKPAPADGELDHVYPHLLPGGKQVLFTIRRSQGFDIGLLSLETSKWQVVIKNGQSPKYVPTGHIVYGSGGVLKAVRFTPGDQQVTGDPIEVQPGVVTKASGAADFDVAPTGVLAYLPGEMIGREPYGLVWRNPDGSETVTGVSLPAGGSLKLSPNARFMTLNDGNGLWLVDLGRELATRMPTGGFDLRGAPVWTPDGQHVVFGAMFGTASEPGGIFQVSVNGTGQPQRLTTAPALAFHLPGSWTQDGRQLVFIEQPGEGERTIRLLTLGGDPAGDVLLTGPHGGAALSPDGHWLAHSTMESGVIGLFLRPFPNVEEARVPVAAVGQNPEWSPDGRTLFFSERAGGSRALMVRVPPWPSRDLGKPEPFKALTDLPQGTAADVAPDGRILLAKRREAPSTAALEYRVVLNWFADLKARVK